MSTSSILRRCTAPMALLAGLLAVTPAVTAAGRSLQLEVARLTSPGFVATPLSLHLDDESLQLTIGRAEADAIGYDGPLDWQCRLTRGDQGERRCSGPLTGGIGEGVSMAATIDASTAQFTLQRDAASLRFQLPLAAGSAVDVDLKQTPIAWLSKPLQRYLPSARLRDGVLDAHVVAASAGVIDIAFSGQRLSADIVDGVALQAVNASGNLHWDGGLALPQFQLKADVDSGAIQTPLTRIQLPPVPSPLQVDAEAVDASRWAIRRLDWRDAGVLEFSASADIDPAAATALTRLSLKITDADLEPLRQRYLAAVIEQAGLASLSTRGRLQGELDLQDGNLVRVDLRSSGIHVEDPVRQLKLDGLKGRFAWAPRGTTPAAELRWASAQLGAVRSGPLALKLRSRDGAIELDQPVSFAIAGGDAQLRSLRLDPLASVDRDLVNADIGLNRLSYDSADGRIAAAGVSADVQLALADPFGLPRLAAVTRWQGGELLYNAFYVKLPDTAVDVAVQAQALGPQRWSITQFDASDPGVIDFRAQAELDLAATRWLPALKLDLSEISLAPAADRYARSWLAANGYGDIVVSGKLAGEIDFDTDGLQRFALYADRVGIDDGAGRFELRSLSGGVDWAFGSARPATTIGWDGMKFYKIPFGPAVAALASRDGAIELTDAMTTAVLGGKLKLEKLSLQPRSPRGERYRAALSIAGIEMSQLSEALGWPRFPGNLSGGIPDITFAGDSIELGGGLALYVFDGKVDISGVSLQRPFGVAPSLGAGIYLRNLDLTQLTSALEIAAVSGRLDGDIKNLRMVDWSPVSFDAWLRTRGGGRMSYKVVQDVTSIGGGFGSITTALQNLAMKVVDTFGYRQLGIRCKLVDTVCTMGGIDASGDADSYTIVDGSGLPRISIVGHRRRVDWPTFVDRVVEAITGNGPIVK